MPRRKRKLEWLKWVVILVLVIAAIVIVVLVRNELLRSNGDNGGFGSKGETVQDVEKNKNENKTGVTIGKTEESEEKKEVPQYEGNNPNEKNELTGAITYAAVSGGNLMVRVNIDQFLNGGTCELKLMRHEQELYRGTAAIVDNVTTSTCEGFNFAVDGMIGGKAQIVVMLRSADKAGEITGEVEL